MNSKLKNRITYIYWQRESELINLSNEDFRKKFDELVATGHRNLYKTLRKDFLEDGSFYVEKVRNWKKIFCKEKGKYICYSTNEFDNSKNTGDLERNGGKAIAFLIHEFATRTKLGAKAFSLAFGTTEEDFKACVPKQFVFVNKLYLDKVYHHISSIDGCSQYPSSLCGDLPDAKYAKTCQGTVAPTADYPFAYYLKSGHVAEYNKFDTHDWMRSQYALYLFSDIRNQLAIQPDEDVTVLMPKSQYTLDEEWKYFYTRRKDDSKAKLVMNASIGMMHQKVYTSYKYAHLAALCIARANDKHLKMLEKIGFKNIIHVCVDGIIYNSSIAYGEPNKRLGRYVQEFQDCDFCMIGANAYIAKKNNAVVKVKHGAFNANEDGSPIIDTNVKDFKDMEGWQRIMPTKDIQ